MTGPPTAHVLLDDGTGTFPIDITTKVRLPDGITRLLGRGDELSEIQPGQLTLVCDHDATLASQLVIDRQIRVTYNGDTRGTWFIRAKPVSWPSGGDEYAVITLTAVDAWSNFAGISLGSAFDEEILTDADTLVAYYPLTGGSDTTVEYDASGFGSSRLTVVNNGGPIPVWGDDYASADGTTGLNILQQAGAANNCSFLAAIWDGFNIWNGTDLHAEFVLTADVGLTTTQDYPLLQIGSLVIYITVGGRISIIGASGVGYGSNLRDGTAHIVTVEATVGGTFDIWVDGVKIASAVTTPAVVLTNIIVQVGSQISAGSPGLDTHYTIARVNIGSTRLSDPRIAAHHLAALSDCAGETPAQRYVRVCAYAAIPTGAIDTLGDTICGPAGQAEKSLTDVLSETALATLGIVYVDANGAVSSLNGYSMVGAATPLTLDANWADESTVVEDDTARVLNAVTGKTTSSANIITARDQASIDVHGRYRNDFVWNVSTDDQAFQLTWWEVNTYAEPRPRTPQLKIDLLSMDATNLAAALTLKLGSYLRVTTMPSQTPGSTTLDLVVENLVELLSDSEWSLTLTCVSRDTFGAWILGDSVWGVLGTTTKPFV